MARFKNVSGWELAIYAPSGQADSFAVPADGFVEVPGEVVEEGEDHYVVQAGEDENSRRAWAKANWQVTQPDDTGTEVQRTEAPRKRQGAAPAETEEE